MHGLRRGEFAGNFKCFVDDDCARRIGISQQLGYGSAQQIPVDSRHALHTPVLGMLLDEQVDFANAIGRDTK